MDHYAIADKLLAEIAQRKGKEVSELRPWVDYDPIMIDEQARYEAVGRVRFAGD